MAKRWSVTSFLALALLGCLFGTEVEAWDSLAEPRMTKGAPPPQAPLVILRLQAPKVETLSAPMAPHPAAKPQVYTQLAQYSQVPKVETPSVPMVPHPAARPQVYTQLAQYSQVPKVETLSAPMAPHPAAKPQVYPQQTQYSQAPKVQTSSTLSVSQHTAKPQVYTQLAQYSQAPKVETPSAPMVPHHAAKPQVYPQQTQHSQAPKVELPLAPMVPHPAAKPQVYTQLTQYSQAPKVETPSVPLVPHHTAKPQVYPQQTQYSQAPKVQTSSTPMVPHHAENPQVYTLLTQYSQARNVQTSSTPSVSQHTAKPQVYTQLTQYSQAPKVQTSSMPSVSQHIAKPPVYPRQTQYSQLSYGQTPYVYPRAFPPQALKPQQPHESLVSYESHQPHHPYKPYQPQQQTRPQQSNQPQNQHQPYQPYKPNPPQQQNQPQKPHHSQPPSNYHPGVPKQPSFQRCEVAESQKVPCGGNDISPAACEAISCCFDSRQCYFGKAVTVQCTKDAQFIVVVAKDATLPNIDLESISLLGEGRGCTHVASSSEFTVYQFPVTACGSVVMEEPGVIIYENRMFSLLEVDLGSRGIITRDSSYELLFQCRYIGTSVETLIIEVFPPLQPPLSVAALGPIRVNLQLANGQCNTKGCNEADAAYSSFYADADYPVTKVLREPVYAEVQLLEKTDPNLVLTLGRCWTTSTHNPHTLPQWDILTDGCPYMNDRYMSSLVPVGPSSGLAFPTHYRRFIFKMFAFVDPNSMQPLKEQVYLHCSTAVCTGGLGRNCEPSCFRKRKRDVKAVDQTDAEPKVVASVGPLIMVAPEN